MSATKDKIIPFYCGSQIMDWKLRNCERCAKGHDGKDWHCHLEKGMDEAYMFGNGEYSPWLARAIGTPDDCRVYSWQCPEFKEISE